MAALLLLLLLTASAAGAEPALQDRQADARAVLAQVRQLDEEVGMAAERWNGANLRLRSIEAELRSTRAGLKRARLGYGVAQRRAADRLVELYVAGAPDPALEVILGAQSLGEVLDALDANERIADQDANLIQELKRYGDETKAKTRRLGTARTAQRTVVRRLGAERAAIEARLAERRRMLASVQSEINRLEAAERAREAALQREALADVARQQAAAEPPGTGDASPSAVQDESAPPPPTGSRGAQVVAIAMRYLGVPYKWGGASPSTGFDCSGFTMYVFAQIGVSLPHFAAAQFGMGVPVSRSQLQPGDLVFFRGLGHMGMYIGGGNFIHSPRTGDVVKISSLSEPYRVANWVGARRVL